MAFTETPERIKKLIHDLYENPPQIEAERAVLLTESYQKTEAMPMIKRRALAYVHILKHLPIVIRPGELIVGSNAKHPRSCQVFPEYSFAWLEAELDTVATRKADPFYIDEDTKKQLREIFPYWKGKTTSELATEYMAPEAKTAIAHNIFTVGNYYYNGIGHMTVDYGKILKIGFRGLMHEAAAELASCKVSDADYAKKHEFLEAVILCCQATIDYSKRYARLARETAQKEQDATRREELLLIAENCERVPEHPARSFMEACQSFWFVQMLLQTESSGHSISPGRFDQYMYPYFRQDIDNGTLTEETAQELLDCIWVKLNDLNKVRDAASAEGFAGYSLFQNLCVGGQDASGLDATNELSYLCIQASAHTRLPQPSLSVRVWNGTPDALLFRCAELTRTGIGLPAYYNDEVIIPSLMSRGLTLEDARDYNIIGCVEPQKAAKTDGWHDAAFFNMCRPLELVFSNGTDRGELVGIRTGEVEKMQSFEEFFEAYKKQMQYAIGLLVNADNAVDTAHGERCPLPFQSAMVENCMARGKSLQEGGAVYNFTGPQGFGIANVCDSMLAIRQLVFEEKKITLAELKEALAHNFGHGLTPEAAQAATEEVVSEAARAGKRVSEAQIAQIFRAFLEGEDTPAKRAEYQRVQEMIDQVPHYGNDIPEADQMAREVAYVYTRELEKYRNPRGGIFQAGLYPVSANVPLGQQTGATPDGRLANTPVADGVGPRSGKDTNGPTAAANSVARLDHCIASNGTLYNQKFHPSALKGDAGLQKFAAYIRAFFDQKGMHMQFNVVSKETLLDAQKHPENYKNLVVRVAGYSALFTTLSKSLQDDIINRTEQAFSR